MSIDVSKYCADFLRNSVEIHPEDKKFKASHARELVAAYFGYKSHAALLADTEFMVNRLQEAHILAPNVPMIEQRREDLVDLPSDLPTSRQLAQAMSDELQVAGMFSGKVWLYDSLEDYVMEQLLHTDGGRLLDELSGVMAETNAYFDDPHFEHATITEDGDETLVKVEGTYSGTTDEDKPFAGDKIDMTIQVRFTRVAGHTGFTEYAISASGQVNDDGYEPDEEHDPVLEDWGRGKTEFIERTGGFRFGETEDQFRQRQANITAIRRSIAVGRATEDDVDRLSELLGLRDESLF